MAEYEVLKRELACGWNTWNTRSVLSHVLLPEGVALNLGIKEYRNGGYLREALIGRLDPEEEQVRPGLHAYDGSYSELDLSWRGIELRIRSGLSPEGDLVLSAEPLRSQPRAATLVVEAAILWNRPGTARRDGDALRFENGAFTLPVFGTEAAIFEPNAATTGPYLALPLSDAVGVSTGRARSMHEIDRILTQRKADHLGRQSGFGASGEIYDAIQTCLAWDTIYDPMGDRVISPVSRIWNVNHGGYVLFCWDTYFAAWMAGIDHKALAYANAIEITRSMTKSGFVPNFVNPSMKSRDRSQPPVGSWVVRELYRRYGEDWFVAEVFDDLLRWNRWWFQARRTGPYLAWGSTPYEPRVGNQWETEGVGGRLGAALESGLDNSPMYDDLPFDPKTHTLPLADAGLMGLYAADCEALAELAEAIGRDETVPELLERREQMRHALGWLWDDHAGIFRNRRTDTREFSPRLSPTSFYPLLAGAATTTQAGRMVNEHLLNPNEFWGDWVIPSIARNDSAYPEQDYWRGRIWAPMNLLVYLGLRRYDQLKGARAALAEKSKQLLLLEWRAHRHVHENYCADTGSGCDRGNSDRFYHWGGLLGMIALMESGHL